MDDIERLSYALIHDVVKAQDKYLTAIQYAKKKKFKEAQQAMKEGTCMYIRGHREHVDLLQEYASSASKPISLLLVHAEDCLMRAESFKIIADEFISLYRTLYQK